MKPAIKLLPLNYTGQLKDAIVESLKPYQLTEREVGRPEMKWQLSKAVEDSEPLLQKAVWKRYDGEGEDGVTDWKMTAYTLPEIRELETLVAGIVAREILDPKSGYAIRNIEHLPGGEQNLVISQGVKQKLAKDFPDRHEIGDLQDDKYLQAESRLLQKFRRIMFRASRKGNEPQER